LQLNRKIGEQGSQISGGQLQRIAIARLLLKNPPIIFLDEATSALDVDTKTKVADTLVGITTGFTTIIVTHDMNLVVNADQILVFDQGKLVEQGNFDQLLLSDSEIATSNNHGEEKQSQTSGHFLRMFRTYAQQIGQSVKEVSSSMPRKTPTLQKRDSRLFQQETHVDISPVTSNDNNQSSSSKPLLHRSQETTYSTFSLNRD